MSDIDGGVIGGVKKTKAPMAKMKSLCLSCEYFSTKRHNGKLTCKAFMNGIPNDFIDAKKQHIVPVKGDSGITYMPRRKKR